jgi:hypothetical protein
VGACAAKNCGVETRAQPFEGFFVAYCKRAITREKYILLGKEVLALKYAVVSTVNLLNFIRSLQIVDWLFFIVCNK